MRETKLSRRTALRVLGMVPLMSAGLAACGGDKSGPESCNDVSALSDAEKAARSALQYVDKSPYPDKKCKLCNLYLPAAEASQCGGCQVVKGPVHPEGYCTAFVKKV
jgi:hypothetical protein